MARKIIQKYVQGSLFGEDEIKIIRSKPLRYDAYIQGARDMLLRCLNMDRFSEKQQRMKNLPRRYMKAAIELILSDESAMQHFIDGKRFTFVLKDGKDGTRKQIVARLK